MGLLRDWSVRTRKTVLSSFVIGVLCLGFCGLILVGMHSHAVSDQANRILLADMRGWPASSGATGFPP